MGSINRQQILYIAVAVCLVLAGWQWGLVPALNYRQDLVDRYDLNAKRLDELLSLQKRLQAAREKGDQGSGLDKKEAGFTLFSFLEQLASRADVKENIEYMKPSTKSVSEGLRQEMVQMRLEEIRLAKLSQFLESVEYSGKGVFFESLTIRSSGDNPGILRADLLAGTYQAAE
ncbi:MAG: hypothetical protein K9K64_14910 [Desulfohalobiaceae bacterium]|nr:hypothetical protein [Desulfohalobiaceae bacterium]MCF8106771.1 hypothetical protein [Desulfohalobiaceae bacterium]